MLLDPGDMGLRGRFGNREAGLEAGLSDVREGRYAGSLWYIPSLAHFWRDWGRRVDSRSFHCHMGAALFFEPVRQFEDFFSCCSIGAKFLLSLSIRILDDQTDPDGLLMHITPCAPWVEYLHLPALRSSALAV